MFFATVKKLSKQGNYSQKRYVSIAFSCRAFIKSNAMSGIRVFWQNDLLMKILTNLDRL